MNKPRALWKYLKRRGKNRFQLSRTQHISSCQPGWERAAPFNSLWESCRRRAIKIKPASSESVRAQPQHQQGGEFLAASYAGESVPRGKVLPGSLRSRADSDSRHRPPTLPGNTPHSREKKNIWGQSERKALQGRASSVGRCGVSVIGGAWKRLPMKETLHGEEGLVLFGKRQNGWIYCLHTNSKWDGSVFPSLLLQAESKTRQLFRAFTCCNIIDKKMALGRNHLIHSVSLFFMHFWLKCWTVFTVLT